MTKDFVADFHRFKNKILSKENFSLVRYGDGEIFLMKGMSIGLHTQAFQVDGWYCENKNYKLGSVLLDCLNHREDNFYYALPSPNQNISNYSYLRDRIQQDDSKITFADIWVNGNYPKFKKFLNEELNEPVVLIASNNAANRDISPIQCKAFVGIPTDVVHLYENEYKNIEQTLSTLAKTYQDTLFMVSAGPLSEAIIHHLYCSNPNNRYIDFGSSLDEVVHGRKTRPYMEEGTQFYGEIVKWEI